MSGPFRGDRPPLPSAHWGGEPRRRPDYGLRGPRGSKRACRSSSCERPCGVSSSWTVRMSQPSASKWVASAVQGLLQNMLVEKEDRGQSLVLSRRRDVHEISAPSPRRIRTVWLGQCSRRALYAPGDGRYSLNIAGYAPPHKWLRGDQSIFLGVLWHPSDEWDQTRFSVSEPS